MSETTVMTVVSPSTYTALSKALLGQENAIPWHQFTTEDWKEFVSSALAERVAPLLCYGFRHRGWPAEMPEHIRQLLLKEFYNAVANASLMFRELEHVLAELEKNNIQVVLLKGSALALTLYPHIALRPMADLDLLIRLPDLSAAIEVVEAIAYVPENPPMRRRLHHLFFYETNFRGGDRALTQLELHWDLVGGADSRYRPDIDWFWDQTKTIRIGNISTLILSPTAYLLHAAVHVSLKHGGEETRLLWLYDLHLLITQCQDLDWKLLIKKAKEFHWLPVVEAVLNELTRKFSTSFPAWIFDACAHENDTQTRLLVQQMAAARHTRTTGMLAHLAFLSRPARIRWLAAVVFPDPEYMRWRYRPRPMWLWPGCYFVRWADMARDAIGSLGRYMRTA